MLLNVIKYSGLYVKVKALESKLLTYDDFYDLANQKTVTNLAKRLFENSGFSEYTLEMQDAVKGGRVTLEKSITQSMYTNFAGVFSFLRDQQANKYLNVLFLKYKVGIIKGFLRSLYDERTSELHVPKYNQFFHRRINFDIEKVVHSKTLGEFMDNLKNTEFHSILSKINDDVPSLFDLETQLDFYCYSQTWKYQQKFLKGKDRESQSRLNGIDIDIHNIMYIYRFKKYYTLDTSIIYTNLIPISYKLNKNTIKLLVDSSSEDEFRHILNKTPYKDVFKDCPMSEMERAYYGYMLKIQCEEERKNPYSLALVTTYFFRKGQEVRNLITLIECVRYGLKPDVSMRKLNIEPRRGDVVNG